jgi:hypothetical protein
MSAVVLMDAKHDAGFCPVMAGGVQFRLTGAEGLDYYDAHPEIKQAVLTAPATVSRLAPRSFLVYCFLKFSGKDEQHARNFLIDLTNGESTGQGDPVELLRNRLLENRASKSKLKKKELLALIIKAWNFDRSGERPDNLRWISSGPRAESFPEVQ